MIENLTIGQWLGILLIFLSIIYFIYTFKVFKRGEFRTYFWGALYREISLKSRDVYENEDPGFFNFCIVSSIVKGIIIGIIGILMLLVY